MGNLGFAPVSALTVFLNAAGSHQPLPGRGLGVAGSGRDGAAGVTGHTALLSHSPASPGSKALRRNLVTLHPPSPVPCVGGLFLAALRVPQDHKSRQSRITTIARVEHIKGKGLWEPQGFRGSWGEASTQAEHGPTEQNTSLGTPAGALGRLHPRSPCRPWRLPTVTQAEGGRGAQGFPPS